MIKYLVCTTMAIWSILSPAGLEPDTSCSLGWRLSQNLLGPDCGSAHCLWETTSTFSIFCSYGDSNMPGGSGGVKFESCRRVILSAFPPGAHVRATALGANTQSKRRIQQLLVRSVFRKTFLSLRFPNSGTVAFAVQVDGIGSWRTDSVLPCSRSLVLQLHYRNLVSIY